MIKAKSTDLVSALDASQLLDTAEFETNEKSTVQFAIS